MDRRMRRSREAIFRAFDELLTKKKASSITVGEIIEKADIGRATFYAHFETKDQLLEQMCGELFCHLFDAAEGDGEQHRHIFSCDAPSSVYLHLFNHFQKNDNHILELLSCQNNDLFFQYFKENLQKMVIHELPAFENRKNPQLPDSFWINHISSTFVETVRWWIDNGMKESPETITQYFYLAV